MKKYYVVSFQKSESIYCSNIAHAESVADVEAHYSRYSWYKVDEATEGDLREAERKGKPIVEIDPAPVEEPEAETAVEAEDLTKTARGMKATITATENHALKISDRKESRFYRQITGFACDGSDICEAVTLRFYHTSERVYACIWVHSGSIWTGEYISLSGSGRAGGGGYHKPSQAAEDAMLAAGITLSESIGGRGESMMREAVEAITRAVCPGKDTVYYVHEANA